MIVIRLIEYNNQTFSDMTSPDNDVAVAGSSPGLQLCRVW